MPATVRGPWSLVRRWTVFTVGALLLSVGVATGVSAGRGVASWQVFETGVVAAMEVPFAAVAVIESALVVLIAWRWLGQRPGPATLVFVVAVGPLVGTLLGALSEPRSTTAAWSLFTFGAISLTVGIGLYIGAGLGASPQDGLFVGITKRYGISEGWSRFLTDAMLVTAGWRLGGQVGIGTVVLTLIVPLFVGPSLQLGRRLAGVSSTAPREHEGDRVQRGSLQQAHADCCEQMGDVPGSTTPGRA